ncbi:MAG TPA: VOC family protein [Rudaea sp.]|nr:VOC family protein [Rudaea sp.]
MATTQIRKSTPVLIVDAIEPSLPFWQERLGFERPIEVPDGERLGFVILTNGAVEVMYQTSASLAKDSTAHNAAFDNDKTFLFVEVSDIDALASALQGFEIVMPRRETFYGSTEIGYREPGGHFVTFAQMKR